MAGIILVVDDDEDIRETLRVILELEDYQVLVASNGREALEVMRTNRPQLILLDLMMPVLDGWEFVKELDEDPEALRHPNRCDHCLCGSRAPGAALPTDA